MCCQLGAVILISSDTSKMQKNECCISNFKFHEDSSERNVFTEKFEQLLNIGLTSNTRVTTQ